MSNILLKIPVALTQMQSNLIHLSTLYSFTSFERDSILCITQPRRVFLSDLDTRVKAQVAKVAIV